MPDGYIYKGKRRTLVEFEKNDHCYKKLIKSLIVIKIKDTWIKSHSQPCEDSTAYKQQTKKELSSCHKLWCFNVYIFNIFAIRCRQTLIFQPMKSMIRSNSLSLKVYIKNTIRLQNCKDENIWVSDKNSIP